jgi:hypothetical protein
MADDDIDVEELLARINANFGDSGEATENLDKQHQQE